MIKTFCITLKENEIRKKYCVEHFNTHKLEVDFFHGFHGEKFGLKTTIPYMDDNPTGPEYFINSGVIGSTLSHLSLWKTLQYLPYDEFLILEDDVILCDDFVTKFNTSKNSLPSDWEFVFVGNCCLNKETNIKINDFVSTNSVPPMCLHAYMIKKSIISKLIETNSIAWAPIDIQLIRRTFKDINVYLFDPVLATQKSLYNKTDLDFISLTQY